ncbi:MAG: LutC/YkgG family protein [Candidatus Binatia bacterium]
MSERENILTRVRGTRGESEVTERSTAIEAYIARHARGPQPSSNWDLVARFKERALGLLSSVGEVNTMRDVPKAAARYLDEHQLPRQAVCWPGLSRLPWNESGIVVEPRAAHADDLVGITGVFCAIAETGTLMLVSGEATHAVTSLLPETHVAVVNCARILASMEDAWSLLRAESGNLPRAVNFVSGPSRTADIEQTITLGAHGPYRVHIILVKE